MGLYVNFGSDLPGSCDKDAHKEWMEVNTFGHGVDRPYATGGRWDPADFHDFVFTKKNDKASPLLNEAILAGKCFDKVEVHFCTTVGAEEELPVYTLELEKVRVTSYGLDGQAVGDSMETVSMYADKVTWKYSVQDEEAASGEVMYVYDVKGRTTG